MLANSVAYDKALEIDLLYTMMHFSKSTYKEERLSGES